MISAKVRGADVDFVISGVCYGKFSVGEGAAAMSGAEPPEGGGPFLKDSSRALA